MAIPNELVLELSSEFVETGPWTATEWRLKLTNNSKQGASFGSDVVTRNGGRDAVVLFEVEKVGTDAKWSIPANPYVDHGHESTLDPGASKELMVKLHGFMQVAPKGQFPGDPSMKVFVPTFDGVGVYHVTASYKWDQGVIESNAVKMIVAKPSSIEEGALKAFKELAKKGVPLDIRELCLAYNDKYIMELSKFVSQHSGTVYSDQMRTKLAMAFLLRAAGEELSNGPDWKIIIEWRNRAKKMLSTEFTVNSGLSATVASLRSRKELSDESLRKLEKLSALQGE